jgi:GDP-4-dehydro-6-deoxy-D-mannose reductase
VNYLGTVNLLDALQKLKKFETIFHIPGSGEEYGLVNENELPISETSVLRPVNPYAVSKIAQDLIGYVYNQSYGLKVIRTRAFNHEGPRREKVFGIPWYAYQIARIEKKMQDPIIKTGHLMDKRNFTHIKDMVEAYWLAANKCDPGEMYLIGNTNEDSIFTFKEILDKLLDISNLDKKSIKIQTSKEYVRPTSVPFLIGDMRKFMEKTNWMPKIDVDKILSDTLNYWRDRIENEKYTQLNTGKE